MYLNNQDTEEKPRYAGGQAVVGRRRVCEAFGKEERRGDGEVKAIWGRLLSTAPFLFQPSSLNPLRLLNSLDNPSQLSSFPLFDNSIAARWIYSLQS
jgi:hypothetical protein